MASAVTSGDHLCTCIHTQVYLHTPCTHKPSIPEYIMHTQASAPECTMSIQAASELAYMQYTLIEK